MKIICNPKSCTLDSKNVDRLSGMVGSENLFVSRELQDLDSIIEEIGDDRTVLLAGGDGLFITFCNRYFGDAEIGVLPFGTGNATAYVSGFNDPFSALEDVLSGDYSLMRLPLMKVSLGDGTQEHTHLLSIGDDAEVLHRFKQSSIHRKMARYMGGFPGFAFETLRQVPKMLNLSGNPYHNRHVADVRVNGKRYSGMPCNTVAIGTVPYFGLGFKALPLAGPDVHVRIFNQGVARFAWNFSKIWRGEFVNTGGSYPYLLDIVSAKGSIRMDSPTYCTTAGELRDLQESVDFCQDRYVDFIVRRI